jgi:phosphatidylinositol-3-phosphatase
MENQSYEAMVGSAQMPYLNSLIPHAAIADSYFANTHPSIGNYFILTTGQIITNDSNFSGVISDNNLVRVLHNTSKDWKAYIEDLPAVGYTGGDALPYVKRHNPFAYFSDVVGNSNEANKMVPYTQFSADLAAGNLPDFVYILPNQIHNMHDCPPNLPACTNADKLRSGDDWLADNLQRILDSTAFQQRPTLLIFTMDESEHNDVRHGGGRVVTLMLGSKAKTAFRSNTFYQHQSLLRLVLEVLDVPERPGASQGAPSMAEFLR